VTGRPAGPAGASGASAPAAPSGILVVDKPPGWTSHDVVARVRRLAGTRKVGHAGTLDPMATGVLVLGLGHGTKLLTYLVGSDKTYAATIRLGASTVTDDAEGELVESADPTGVRADALTAAVRALTGPIQQRPSAVSAIKVDGKRSYARVRAGEQVELAARPVTVHRFDVLGQQLSEAGGRPVLDLTVEVEVSSGTYVRALARDLGASLGVGGHLVALRRTQVGPFGLAVARSLDDLERAFGYVPLADAARATFPARELDAAAVRTVRFGQPLDPTGSGDIPVAAFGPGGELVAMLHDLEGQARSLFVVPDVSAPGDL
jgi:tRNA pseudouridine55 synthase